MVLKEGDFCFYVDEDAISPLWKGKKFPIMSCISGWSMMNKQSLSINDIYSDSRIPIDVYKPTFVKSLAMVPINTIEPLGAIGTYWKNHYSPSEIEIQLIQTLADSAARAIENIKLYEELEQRVTDRTNQLKEANKELEAFSYSVSHDLRAPLRHISGYVDLLSSRFHDLLPDKGKHYLNSISDSAHQMGALIDDLLEFSRTGRQEMKKEELDMNLVLQEALVQIKHNRNEQNIEWDIANLPNAFGDKSLLRLVWSNLLSNAVKFSRNSTNPRIEINSYIEKQEIIYYVKDNGVGFDMKYSQKLFGVFQRLHSLDDFEGTGIGLANVQRIIHKHSGRTWAFAELDKGAAFYFSLPIHKEY